LLIRLSIAVAGLTVAVLVLAITLKEKFFEGGWATICCTLLVVASCVVVRRHYDWVDRQRHKLDELFEMPVGALSAKKSAPLDPTQTTAIFLTTEHWGPTIHTLRWVQRLFPAHFRNIVFVSAVQVEASAIAAPETVPQRKAKIERSLDQLEAFCARDGLRTARFVAYGIDPVEALEGLIKEVRVRFPDSVCFSNKLILPADRWFSEWLHNQTALSLQRQLHFAGIPLVIFPIKLMSLKS
jgi:K+ transporter